MIVPIRSGEWNQWAGRRDEEFFSSLLNGYGWHIAVRNQDFKRLFYEQQTNSDESETLSIDSVASYWDPTKQRFEAVFIESKRRSNKPTKEDLIKWIEKCRRAQQFIEESDVIQQMLYVKTSQESMECSKSILFLDCDEWKDTWADNLKDQLPLQTRTYGPPRRILLLDQTRALWIQHSLDILGILRSPTGAQVTNYRVYYWKKGFNPNVSFDHLNSEVLLFEAEYQLEDKRDLILICFEQLTTEVANYYSEYVADILDVGAHGYNRLLIFTVYQLDMIAIEVTQNIFKDKLKNIANHLTIEVRVRTLPTGLNR